MLNLNNPELVRSQSYIDGEWVEADSGELVSVVNPATDEEITVVAKLGVPEAKRAINAANNAWSLWRSKTATERSQLLLHWYDLIIENQNDLAKILTAEQGKPLLEAQAEVLYGASYIEWYAEEAKRINGDIIPQPSGDKRLFVIKQPVGVVGAITPWNFPNAAFVRKVAPALAAGCTFVGRPATETPLSALAIAVLAEQAGIPKGVFNVLVGSRSIGAELTDNPLVRKITFTGSTPVGKKLMKQSADTCKKVSMELGGNAPFIVFDDADIDTAVDGAIASKFRNAGQTCVCANRILVQTGIYDEFVTRFVEKAAAFKLGNGLEAGITMGPMINAKAVDETDALVWEALSKGATLASGGHRHDAGESFYMPTVLIDVPTNARVFKEEIFGPVAPIFRFESEQEALELANDTEVGLASYLYTKDISRIWRMCESLEYGMVGINEGIISNAMAPFGGVKESGVGREGSSYGLDDYLEIKYMCLGGL
ncbi:MAG: NAD-dependent succinate-semialdehyde dehydrogenase [Pseudomonadales bacterium]|nr:NAD-dependent succinate-semialdehyde dehydrogenase [Pseudomonadales bacterium]